jgi:hypothetical protein
MTYTKENPIVNKERVVKDMRPYRNMVTGELVYPK